MKMNPLGKHMKTRFDTEAKDNLEMAYYVSLALPKTDHSIQCLKHTENLRRSKVKC